MTEVQVWALIGVFAAVMFSVLSWQTVSVNRTIRTEVGRLDHKIDALALHVGAGAGLRGRAGRRA